MKQTRRLLGIWLGLIAAVPAPALVVYTYDSLAGKGSWGALLKKEYEKTYPGKTLDFVTFPSAGEAINQVVLESQQGKKGGRADVLLGIDNIMLPKVMGQKRLRKLPADLYQSLRPELRQVGGGEVVPFDLGYLALIYDSRRTIPAHAEASLMDLAEQSQFKKKLVLEDPRTSSLGAGFLYYTRQVLTEDQWKKFWTRINQQLFRLPPSWSTGYGMFLNRDADYVLSYTTSPAYHLEQEKTDAFRVLPFKEGQPWQWEGVAILDKPGTHAEEALHFIRLLLSPPLQKEIPTTNWMLPAREGIALPASFGKEPLPAKPYLTPSPSEKERAEWLRAWSQLMAGAPT